MSRSSLVTETGRMASPVAIKIISEELAFYLSCLCTIVYVAVLYLHPSARPTLFVTKDHPSVIRSRILLVCLASVIAGCITVRIGKAEEESWLSSALRILALRWNSHDICSSLLLVVTLFAGPLYEYLVAERGIFELHKDIMFTTNSWVGFRNYIIGPLTEEFVFRACIIPLNIYSGQATGRIILLTPLYFGIAHIHHIYEKTVTKSASLGTACAISMMQFGYTTIFGWLAAFLFVRTGSLWACVLVHSFCNSMGLPRVFGRLPGNSIHTVAYYVFLVSGAILFSRNIERWTETRPYQAYSIA